MIGRYSCESINKIWSDAGKFSCWFDVEIAHLEAQACCAEILAFLKAKQKLIDWDKFAEQVAKHEAYLKHDVLAFLRVLEDEFSDAASKLHRGLTSSDIVDTAFALQLTKAGAEILSRLSELLKALWQKAQENKRKICLGRTHGQAAQPTTVGIKLLGHFCELSRGHKRLQKACEEIAVGKLSGAVGTYSYSSAEVEEKALSILGLRPETVASQIVSRDRHAQFFSTLAIIGGSLERLALEFRLLMHGQVGEAQEPFSHKQQGSSAMPHKKNPVLCENISGLMRLVRSYSLAILENQALWHERDISHSSVERVVAPDATNIMAFCLKRMTDIIIALEFNYEQIANNLAHAGDSLQSQAIMIALIDKGLARSQAYDIIQKAAFKKSSLQVALVKAGINNYLSNDELQSLLALPKLSDAEDLLFDRARNF